MPPDPDPRKRDAGNGLAHPPPLAALDARKLAAVESREHTDYALNVGATLLELTSMNGAERNHYPQASHCGKDLNREPKFQREHPCPSTGRTSGACPGYRKDHIKPLACGGPDAVTDMQWQTVVAARVKDRWELRACGR